MPLKMILHFGVILGNDLAVFDYLHCDWTCSFLRTVCGFDSLMTSVQMYLTRDGGKVCLFFFFF